VTNRRSSHLHLYLVVVLIAVVAFAAFRSHTQAAGPDRQVRVIVSSSDGLRLKELAPLSFTSTPPSELARIVIDPAQTFQTITGFGATFNEAGLVSLNHLNPADQETVLKKLFAPDEAAFTLMSAPIGACDFASAGPYYTYDDVPDDVELKHFSIERDLGPNGLVTFIKRARRHGEFELQTTADYPPDWMLGEKQHPKPELYDAMARYFVKYVQAYASNGVTVDYISPFNEPLGYTKIKYPEIGEFIGKHLGPHFRKAGLRTRIQSSDTQGRGIALRRFPELLQTSARDYVTALCSHGYQWQKEGSEPLSKLHELYPNLPIWQTEVCYFEIGKVARQYPEGGARPLPIYEFEDGDYWGRMIVADLCNWASAWIYWNMILDQKGGPPLVSPSHGDPEYNVQHPVVIVNTETKEVTYTGAYYYLAHFSRFVRPGAVRIGSSGELPKASFVAFRGRQGERVLEVVNSNQAPVDFVIEESGKLAPAHLPPHSIGTFIWK
jgi:glucosylceramidase